MDAANEIRTQFGPKSVVTLGSEKGNVDLHVPVVGNAAWSNVLFVVAAQIQAIVWSDTLRLDIDNPFTTNNLTRVVRGVDIYPLE